MDKQWTNTASISKAVTCQNKRGKEQRQRRCPLRLVCSQDGTTSALYRHLQEQKNPSIERVSLCSNFRSQAGNITQAEICVGGTSAPEGPGELHQTEAQPSHVTVQVSQAQGPGCCCHSKHAAGTAQRHRLSSTATAWMNGDWPHWSSKISL